MFVPLSLAHGVHGCKCWATFGHDFVFCVLYDVEKRCILRAENGTVYVYVAISVPLLGKMGEINGLIQSGLRFKGSCDHARGAPRSKNVSTSQIIFE